MAAPAGSGAVEAYKTTKSRGANPSVSAAEFVPKAAPAVVAKASELHRAAGASARSAVYAQDPFKGTGIFKESRELPPGTYGGKKSRRRKTRRRGGAMQKTVRELVVDLERDPSEATLRNVLSDLKESPNDVLRVNSQDQERILNVLVRGDGEPRRREVDRMIRNLLPIMRNYQYGGRRRKTTHRR
jgi:hypothetical protein